MTVFKPFQSIEELVQLLSSRGLIIEDTLEMQQFLYQVNYYRFSGYAREFQNDPIHGDNKFACNTTFNHIKELMVLDANLRHRLLQQLEVVEVAIRARLAHELGRKYGEHAFYLDTETYVDINGKPESIVDGIQRDLSRSNSRMVKHYVSPTEHDTSDYAFRYREVPIWVAVEVMSFGRITNMLTYMKDPGPARCVAEAMGVQWSPFANVVHSLAVLRNTCAHWMQLWHRPLDIQCPVQKKLRPRGTQFSSNSVYAAIVMLNHYRKKIDGDISGRASIEQLLEQSNEFKLGICRPAMK